MSIDKPSILPIQPVSITTAPQKIAAQGDQDFNLNFLPGTLSAIIDRPVMQVGSLQDQARLSNTAHLITDLLQAADEMVEQKPFQAAGVQGVLPKDVPAFTMALKIALSQSGLFYESHITDVMAGRRSPQELIQDPKNKQSEATPNLITQQLAMLDEQKLLWSGQIWPGQNMEWMINFAKPPELSHANWVNEEAGQHSQQAEASQYVMSEIKLTLPKLGKLSAQISFVDGQIGVVIKAEEPGTQALLDQDKSRLAEAMLASGQRLSKLDVDLL